MSSSLYWQPVFERDPNKERVADCGLKSILAKRFSDHDGSLCHGEGILRRKDIPYLRGLADAGVDSAAEMLQDLEEFGCVHWHIQG